MKLLDIIYCDSKRIESYLEQIQLRKILNRFPNWLSEVQIPGFAKISLKKYLKISDRNDFDKSFELIKFLNDTKILGIGRADRQGKNTPDFYFESCTATRMYFEHPNYPNFGFSYWISDYESSELNSTDELKQHNSSIQKQLRDEEDFGNPGKLFLLEDFERQDKIYLKRMSSPTSFLWALGYDELLEIYFSRLNVREVATNPVYALEQIGFKTTIKRKITVLYKIRDLFPESFANGYQFTTIGYPLVIFGNSLSKELTLEDILNP